MATNLALDDRLIKDAVKLGGHKTKRAAVTAALEEYIKSKKRVAILDMFGKIDFDHSWDYKAARRRGNK
ncbi:MAG TPA: type II toxin-antitoxin system VapB family antitoxin [Tepidisphaeraceae bacterium]|nr:type II toxin-antitoxin system VapB family antitoxin [Tepidisphaeraceae bacterium]